MFKAMHARDFTTDIFYWLYVYNKAHLTPCMPVQIAQGLKKSDFSTSTWRTQRDIRHLYLGVYLIITEGIPWQVKLQAEDSRYCYRSPGQSCIWFMYSESDKFRLSTFRLYTSMWNELKNDELDKWFALTLDGSPYNDTKLKHVTLNHIFLIVKMLMF